MFKKISLVLLTVILLNFLSSCWIFKSPEERILKQSLYTDVSDKDITYYFDDHGGFHGDGESIIIFTPTEEYIEETITKHWNATPVPPQIYDDLFVFEECPFPKENMKKKGGYYTFNDHNPTSLHSHNFTFAYFDGESVYFYKLDT